MSLLEKIVARAKADKQRIVLPEAEEERTLKAADKVLADDLADLILIGDPANIKKEAEQWGLTHIDKATIIDPLHCEKNCMMFFTRWWAPSWYKNFRISSLKSTMRPITPTLTSLSMMLPSSRISNTCDTKSHTRTNTMMPMKTLSERLSFIKR